MKLRGRIYVSLTKILPKSYVTYFEKLMRYAGEKENAFVYLGSSLLLSILVFIMIVAGGYYYTDFSILLIVLIAFISFVLIQILYYLITYFKMEKRAELVECSLSDQLQLMSNNIKSGMTPFHALRSSARKEFGPLSEEIDNATNKALSNRSFTDALLDINSRIKSIMLERVLKLEASSFARGTKLTTLLNELADDIRETRALRREMITKTKTYVAFILFTVLLGTPALLAISIHFVTMISGFSSIVPTTSGANFGLGMFAGGVAISPDFLVKLSYVMLAMTTILASMLLGVFQKGRAISGLRFAPVLIFSVFVIFTVARYLVTQFFGAML